MARVLAGKGVFTKRHISGGELLMEYRGDLRKTKTWESENVVFVVSHTNKNPIGMFSS